MYLGNSVIYIVYSIITCTCNFLSAIDIYIHVHVNNIHLPSSKMLTCYVNILYSLPQIPALYTFLYIDYIHFQIFNSHVVFWIYMGLGYQICIFLFFVFEQFEWYAFTEWYSFIYSPHNGFIGAFSSCIIVLMELIGTKCFLL